LIRPLFIVWNPLKAFEQFALKVSLDLESFGSQWSALYEEKCCNVFIKNLIFFSTEERTALGWHGGE